MEPQNHAPFVQASAGHTIILGRREKKPEKTKKKKNRKEEQSWSPGATRTHSFFSPTHALVDFY